MKKFIVYLTNKNSNNIEITPTEYKRLKDILNGLTNNANWTIITDTGNYEYFVKKTDIDSIEQIDEQYD